MVSTTNEEHKVEQAERGEKRERPESRENRERRKQGAESNHKLHCFSSSLVAIAGCSNIPLDSLHEIRHHKQQQQKHFLPTAFTSPPCPFAPALSSLILCYIPPRSKYVRVVFCCNASTNLVAPESPI